MHSSWSDYVTHCSASTALGNLPLTVHNLLNSELHVARMSDDLVFPVGIRKGSVQVVIATQQKRASS